MYYPKSEILEVSYTNGGILFVKSTKASYTGYYYFTNDGKYFSGKEYSASTQELVPEYDFKSLPQDSKSYEFHYPTPDDKDYEKGVFTRYVIKRVNSGFETILEVDKNDYNKAKLNPLYVVESFSWKITGPLYDVEISKDFTIPGVVNTNQKTVEAMEPKIPGVKNYFTNFAQYLK